MNWMEMRKDPSQVKNEIERIFSHRYRVVTEDNDKIFHSDQSGDFYICDMGNEEPWNFLVIAYKEEDGDSFYPSDYDSLDSLIADMIAEIEDTPEE